MKYLHFYFLLYLALFVSCNKDNNADGVLSHRTIIVYMAADNDLSEDAWNNIIDMQSGYVEKNTNLVVFIDPMNDVPQILRIESGGIKKIKTYSELNSVDAVQMKQVLNDIIGMFPAKSYGLVLWSHGTSWLPSGIRLKSFGEDKEQQMDITDLAISLPVRFDFILMDACLMGAVEVAYELRNKTNFIIASPTEIIFTGFPYKQIIPELLHPEIDLKKVAASYFNFYDKMPGVYRSATISLINTSELDRLAVITAQMIANSIFDTIAFDRSSIQRLDVYSEQYVFDFLDFLEKAFPDADTTPLKEQIGKVVLYEAHTSSFIDEYNIQTCCGLSCYIPHLQRNDLNAYYHQLEWCKAAGFYLLF